MPRTVLIGKTSFLARRFLALATRTEVVAVSHAELDRAGLFDDAACVINFAFDPRLQREPYTADRDIDLAIAKRLSPTTRYVMLSTRMVYGAAQSLGARTAEPATGLNAYGVNKLEIEARLGGLLEERLTVLRIGNVLAWEPECASTAFMQRVLRGLQNDGAIRYDISPFVRKDFVTERYLVTALDMACAADLHGTYNVGSGIPLEVGQVAMWVLEGAGRGQLVVTSPRVADEFWLDMTASATVFGAPPDRNALRAACLELGGSLVHD